MACHKQGNVFVLLDITIVQNGSTEDIHVMIVHEIRNTAFTLYSWHHLNGTCEYLPGAVLMSIYLQINFY